MRLPLVGPEYPARSLAASAARSINTIIEPIQDPLEREKGSTYILQAPGRHLFKDLTAIDANLTPLRGLWSGGGRLFVAAGTKYCEVSSAGALVGSVRTIADDAAHSPVTFIANGTQLAVLSATVLYIDNGAGPTAITLPAFTGTATGLALFTDWTGGDYFDPGMEGRNFTIGVTTKVVDKVLSPTTLTVTVSWGGAPVSGAYTCTPLMPVASIAAMNGYLIAVRNNSRQFNVSPLLDWTNGGTYIWDPLDFAQADAYPDYIRSVLVVPSQIYFFKSESIEVWGSASTDPNTVSAGFPFQRIDGATSKFGSASVNGPCAVMDSPYFLGGDSTGWLTAYAMDGYRPRRISTHAQEYQWNTQLLGLNACTYSYMEEGHVFWVASFGTGALNWVYDVTASQTLGFPIWTERGDWNGSVFGAYAAKLHTFVTNEATSANDWGADGKHLAGGNDGTGKVWQYGIIFFDQNGADMAGQQDLPYSYNEGKKMFFGQMELEIATGMVASGAAPLITRSYSDDRGNTFVNAATASLGTHNQFGIHVKWPAGGSSFGRVWRLAWAGQSKIALVALNVDRWDGTS